MPRNTLAAVCSLIRLFAVKTFFSLSTSWAARSSGAHCHVAALWFLGWGGIQIEEAR